MSDSYRLTKNYNLGRRELIKEIENRVISEDEIIANKIQSIQAENNKLRECVEFYADPKNIKTGHEDIWGQFMIFENDTDDLGKLARQTLKEIDNGSE